MARPAAPRETEIAQTKLKQLQEDLPARVADQRDKCIDGGTKTSGFFRSLGQIAKDLGKALPREHSALRKDLAALSKSTKDITDVPRTQLTRPLTRALQTIAGSEISVPATVVEVFDELWKLLYPESTDTQKRGKTTRRHLQEFQSSKISTEEAGQLQELSNWIQSSSGTERAYMQKLLGIDSSLLIRSLLAEGSTLVELEEALGISKSSISRIARGERLASEDAARRIAFFHFFDE